MPIIRNQNNPCVTLEERHDNAVEYANKMILSPLKGLTKGISRFCKGFLGIFPKGGDAVARGAVDNARTGTTFASGVCGAALTLFLPLTAYKTLESAVSFVKTIVAAVKAHIEMKKKGLSDRKAVLLHRDKLDDCVTSMEKVAGNVCGLVFAVGGIGSWTKDVGALLLPALNFFNITSLVGGALAMVLNVIKSVQLGFTITARAKLALIKNKKVEAEGFRDVMKRCFDQNGEIRSKLWFKVRGLTDAHRNGLLELAPLMKSENKDEQLEVDLFGRNLVRHMESHLNKQIAFEAIAIVTSVVGLVMLNVLVIGAIAGAAFPPALFIAFGAAGISLAFIGIAAYITKKILMAKPADVLMFGPEGFSEKTLQYALGCMIKRKMITENSQVTADVQVKRKIADLHNGRVDRYREKVAKKNAERKKAFETLGLGWLYKMERLPSVMQLVSKGPRKLVVA